ncbi:MAG: leucine-rich repeat domain-containing protein [Candidatus Helarchaeota archaeon]
MNNKILNNFSLQYLENLLGRRIPGVDKIEWNTFGVLIKEGKIIGLGLYNQAIEKLPESIGNLKSLELLSLSDNLITKLPDSFSQLINLKELILKSNKLTTLPKSFANLKLLQHLVF